MNASIFTDAFAEDAAVFDDYRCLGNRRGTPLVSVVIDCERAENERRLTQFGRVEKLELTRIDVLRDLRNRSRLLRPQGVERFELDVTSLSAEQAALAIQDPITTVFAAWKKLS